MFFQTINDSVQCVRILESGLERVVVEFDANLKKAPPHVVGALTIEELSQLDHWLDERRAIRRSLEAKRKDQKVLAAMPELLKLANRALQRKTTLDVKLAESLRKQIDEFQSALTRRRVKSVSAQPPESFQKSEIFREQIESIAVNS